MSRTTKKHQGQHGSGSGYQVRAFNLKPESLSRPVGNDEYEQSIAEHVLHDKIAEAAFYLAQQRGFTPAHELSDWIQAKNQVGGALTTEFFERRNSAIPSRRHGLLGDLSPGSLVNRRNGSDVDRRH